MLDYFTITDSTTRADLIERVNDLDDEAQQLETKIEVQAIEIESLSLAPEQRARLAEAADLMADLGRIHNTPYAKSEWASGR